MSGPRSSRKWPPNEPPPDLARDDTAPPESAPPADPATIALAIATARGEGDEASAKQLEAMLRAK